MSDLNYNDSFKITEKGSENDSAEKIKKPKTVKKEQHIEIKVTKRASQMTEKRPGRSADKIAKRAR